MKNRQERVKEFLNLYQKGFSREKSAFLSGIPDGSGSYLLKKYGIKARPKGFQLGNSLGDRFIKIIPDEMIRCSYCKKEFKQLGSKIKYYRSKNWNRMYCSKKCSDTHHGLLKRNENHWNWQGKIEQRSERLTEWNRIEYKNWRKSIFERDNYTCKICGNKGGVLNAHHIRSWKSFPNSRYLLDNGITLCKSCHIIEHQRLRFEEKKNS